MGHDKSWPIYNFDDVFNNSIFFAIIQRLHVLIISNCKTPIFFFGLYNNFLMYIYSNIVCSLICINNWPIVYVVLCILRLQSMYSNVFHLFLQAQLPEMHGDPRKTSQCTTIQRKYVFQSPVSDF